MEKEKWIENVLDSMADSQPAKPSADLFLKIEQRIQEQNSLVIQLPNLRIAAAATLILIAVNGLLLTRYTQNEPSQNQELVDNHLSNNQLVSNFQLYQ